MTFKAGRLGKILTIIALGVQFTFAGGELAAVETAVVAIKSQNFFVQTLGVLVAGSLSDADIKALQAMQTARPRQMRIYVTQNEFIKDVYHDFTFLAKEKGVNAILIWPSDIGKDEDFQTKICMMSKRTKVPVIALQSGWAEKGAILEVKTESSPPSVVVNEKVCSIMNYAANEISGYAMIKQ